MGRFLQLNRKEPEDREPSKAFARKKKKGPKIVILPEKLQIRGPGRAKVNKRDPGTGRSSQKEEGLWFGKIVREMK